MPSHYGPDVLDSRLSLLLDPANVKSFSPNENLLLRSNEFNVSAPWSLGEYTYVANSETGPFGDRNAMQATNAGSANNFNFNAQYVTRTDQGYYTYSVFFKNIDATSFTVLFGLNTLNYNVIGTYTVATNAFVVTNTGGSIISSGMTELSNGWKRFHITIDTVLLLAAFSQVNLINLAGGFYVGIPGSTSASLNKKVLVFGAQIEKAGYPSVYTTTTTATVTRPTTITDISGNSRNGTLTNNPLYNSLNNGSIVTNGTTSYIQIPGSASPTGTGDFTLNYWIYLDSNINGNFGGVKKSAALLAGDGTGGSLELFLQTATNVAGPPTAFVVSTYASIGLVGSVSIGVTMPIQVWHNFVIIRDGLSSWKIYHNNVLIGTGNVSTSFPSTTVSNIGALAVNNDYSSYFPGKFGYVAYYNRALSATEVSNNFNSLRGRFNR